jgi:hypothetical protein
MFDVFYSGIKPNRFAHEREAKSIEHAQQLSRTRFFWWISYLADYTDWDWLWEPVPWQARQRHAWASQWQQDSGVYLVPTNWDGQDTNYHSERILRKSGIPVVEIDHLDGTAGHTPNTIKTVRYFDNYKDVLQRVANTLKGQHEYVWVCSSICDYSNFDFSWHPDPWQTKLLHVFASDKQKFGDTFLMHVDSFAERIDQFQLLDWYDVNFVDISVPRRPMPVIHHSFDSQAQAVNALTFDGPLALYTNYDFVSGNLVTVPLWRQETKTIVPLSKGATSVIVPRTAAGYIRTQLYDYPYIDKTHPTLKDQPLDIVFISNGENNAEDLYQHLVNCVGGNFLSDRGYRIKRVQNVQGRVAAYHAAAKASATPWFFAVFGKLEVNKDFDWDWQPDRMQQPKHYIFHAGNPVNGLVYGHQAMIAYNRQLVLENTGVGLDFTLDQAHEVVPIISGTANYAESPWMAWRTAFREALKLRASLPDVENEYRLKVWLKEDSGTIANGHWSHKGAQDAMEFYESVDGNPTELRKSYEWDWLASYAFFKRSLVSS